MQLGYSKMLPQIALGHSQSSIINTAYFENEVLKVKDRFEPLKTASTSSNVNDGGGGQEKDGALTDEGEETKDQEKNQ